MFSKLDLLTLADANLAEFAREHARWLPPTHIEEHGDVLLTAAGTGFPAGPWNCLMPIGTSSAEPEHALGLGRGFFGPKRRGFSVYLRSHLDGALAAACREAGHARISDSPGMVLTERTVANELPSGVTVREARDDADALAFAVVVASAYETLQLPAAVARKLLSQPTRWLAPHCSALLVIEGDRPVAGAMLLFSHGIAGVYWVGTLPDARRRGHAEAVMRSIGNLAFERGAGVVILQASVFGEPLYRRLGYQEFTRYSSYLIAGPLDTRPRA
jgi:ribosomal protein S18 acetylase RimI-like enzyme